MAAGLLLALRQVLAGVRMEVPWVDRPPIEIVRDHVRLTLQPLDAPEEPELLEKLFEQLGSDEMLLFSSDYPHWRFDGDEAIPKGLPPSIVDRMLAINPRETYIRLGGGP